MRGSSVVLVCLIVFGGCGDDDGGGDAVDADTRDTTAPQVTATTPAASATEVDIATTATVTFDEAIDQGTLTSASFTLEDSQGAAVSGTVATNTTGATFTPDTALVYGENYTAKVATTVTDVAGNALAAEETWSFTTHVLSFGTAAPIETDDTGSASGVRIAVDATGNAVAVWAQLDGTRVNIWANRYVVGTGWGTAALIETNNDGSAIAPQVAVDASGNAMAVWQQSNGALISVWANRYVVGTGWGTPTPVDTDDINDALAPSVAVDSAGNALAVWTSSDSAWSSRYVVGTGWQSPGLIESSADSVVAVRVSSDPAGNGTAVWRASDGTRYNAFANRYTAGTGWGTAELIEDDDVGNVLGDPRVAMDQAGNAIVVWSHFNGTFDDIVVNRYVVGTGWATFLSIRVGVTSALDPNIAMNRAGDAVVVWRQFDGTRFNIWSSIFTAGNVIGSGWRIALLVEVDDSFDADNPSVAVDNAGNAVAVWNQFDGIRTNLMANRYVVGTGWGAAEPIETDDAGDARDPVVGVEPAGTAVVVWIQNDGTVDNIWANQLD